MRVTPATTVQEIDEALAFLVADRDLAKLQGDETRLDILGNYIEAMLDRRLELA